MPLHVQHLNAGQIKLAEFIREALLRVVPENDAVVFFEECLIQALGQLLGVHALIRLSLKQETRGQCGKCHRKTAMHP
ncbi:hypothetical protein D3C84_460160 [compost metagenome]